LLARTAAEPEGLRPSPASVLEGPKTQKTKRQKDEKQYTDISLQTWLHSQEKIQVTLLPEQSIPCSPPLLAHTPDALVVGPEAALEGEGAAAVGGVAAALGEEAEGGGAPEGGGGAEVGGAAEGGGAEKAKEIVSITDLR
jgi:hypothetical protein